MVWYLKKSENLPEFELLLGEVVPLGMQVELVRRDLSALVAKRVIVLNFRVVVEILDYTGQYYQLAPATESRWPVQGSPQASRDRQFQFRSPALHSKGLVLGWGYL